MKSVDRDTLHREWTRLEEAARVAEQQARMAECMLRSALHEQVSGVHLRQLENQAVALRHDADLRRLEEEDFVRRHLFKDASIDKAVRDDPAERPVHARTTSTVLRH